MILRAPVRAILFDIDGTLVESNDAHAHAWMKAFAEAGLVEQLTSVLDRHG